MNELHTMWPYVWHSFLSWKNSSKNTYYSFAW